MDIGKLNRRIEVLKYEVQKDLFGGEDGEWVAVDRLWAFIQPVSGKEFFSEQQVQAEVTTTITIRYNPRINVMNRVKYQDKLYEIIGVSDEYTDHRATVLNCKEMTSVGLQCKAKKNKV